MRHRINPRGILLGLLLGCRAAPASDLLDPVVLNDDGGWCWFQDERALALGDAVVFGSIAAGSHDPARTGDVELTVWEPATGAVRRVELHDRLQLDDHDAPALLELDDGRLLAVYAKHGSDELVRSRRTARPGAPGAPGAPDAWEPERTFALERGSRYGVTYANLHHARGGTYPRILNLFRGVDWDPNLAESFDDGATWEWVGRVLGGPGRPYVKYASAGDGPVHLIATPQHPRDLDNGLYHGVLFGGLVLRADGEIVGRVGDDPPAPEELTEVFRGGPDAVAWPADLALDADGRPVAVFTVQTDGAGLPPGQGGMDHRFWVARLGDDGWNVEELGFAGTRLYPREDDYTGLAAIDPDAPEVVVLSTDAHPSTGAPLISAADGRRHRELFRAERAGDGPWRFVALTRDSSADNLRPIVPAGTPHVLLWLRGELRSYTDYSLEVVGAPLPPPR